MPDRISRLSSGLPRSRRGPVTMMRCGSQRNRSAPMPLICSSANSRSSYIQSCTSVAPSACVASTVTRLTRSLGKPGPQAGRDAAGADQLATLRRGTRRRPARSCTLHLAQHRGDDFHVDRPRAADVDLAAGDGADHGPTARLDVVAVERLASRRAAWRRLRRGSCASPRR